MQELINAFLEAKRKEENAKEERLQIEKLLIDAVKNDKLEGTKSVSTATHKLSIANKINRKLDHDEYLKIRDTLPKNLQFVIYKPEISVTVLRHLEAVDPSLVSKCIVTSSAKPSITIKGIEEWN